MKLSDLLADAAAAVAGRDGCTEREAYGKLATACMKLGGYAVAFIDGNLDTAPSPSAGQGEQS